MSLNPSQSWITPGTALFGSGGGGGSIPDPLNVSTINSLALTCSTIRQVSYGGQVQNFFNQPARFEYYPSSINASNTTGINIFYKPLDSGGNATLTLGCDNAGPFILGSWENYITIGLRIAAQDITLLSDNETFFFCQGKAGAIGSISTGVAFASQEIQASTLQATGGGKTADLNALFSTLSDLYPSNFV